MQDVNFYPHTIVHKDLYLQTFMPKESETVLVHIHRPFKLNQNYYHTLIFSEITSVRKFRHLSIHTDSNKGKTACKFLTDKH